MSFDKSNSAGFLVNQLARLFAGGLQERIKPLGLTIGQFPVLLELWEKDGITQKQLLHNLSLEQATLANTLIRMERDGLIKRTKDPSDGRAQKIWLTDKSREVKNSAYEAASDQNALALSDLSKPEQAQYLSLTNRIIRAMQSPTVK